MPATLLIPAGRAAADFIITTVDDTVVEKPESVRIAATAAGYIGGELGVRVIDDDIPTLILALSSPDVLESGSAVTATVTRDKITSRPFVVKLWSGDTSEASVVNSVVIPGGQASATFLVTPVNDGLVDGSQVVTLIANGTYTDCGCTIVEGAGVATLTVLDADTPGLTLTIADRDLAEGLSTTARLTRNTASSAPLVVRLSTSGVGVIVIPSSVAFDAGQTTLTFRIDAPDDGIVTGTKVDSISATADGLIGANATLTISDASGPDLSIGEGAVFRPASGLTGTRVSVGYRVTNTARSAASGAWTDALYLSADQVLSADDLLVNEYRFQGSLPAGLYYERTVPITLPNVAGRYWVIAVTDTRNDLAEPREGNNRRVSAAPVDVAAAYSVTGRAVKDVYGSGEAIEITGAATLAGGGPAAFVVVTIHIATGPFERTVSALTDQTGTFRATWTPLPGEAGEFTLGAAHPGDKSAPLQDVFTVVGMSAAVPTASALLVENTSTNGVVQLTTRTGVPLTGLTVEAVGLPSGVSVAFTPPAGGRLEGNATADLGFRFTTGSVAVTTISVVRLRLRTLEGASAEVSISLTVQPLRAELAVEPGEVTAGMVLGTQLVVGFKVTNSGTVPTGPLTVRLPDGVEWLSLATPPALASLAPGESATVELLLSPSPGLPQDVYRGQLRIEGAIVNRVIPYAESVR